MKRLVLAGIVVLMAGVAAAAVQPDVTIESVSPQPASPGDTVQLHVTVSNDGTTDAAFQPVQVETVNGVSVVGTTDAFANRFSLCGGCKQTGTIRLKVDEEAASGTYPVDIRLATPEGDGVVETVELEVDGTPTVTVSTDGLAIVPGGTATTQVSVRNVGTDAATQTVVSLDTASFAMQPSPLTPGTVPPGGTVTRTVTFTADSGLSDGIEQLDMDVSYNDEADRQSTTATVSADILGQAEVVVSDVTTGDATVGEQGTITVTLENLGPGEAERIVADLSCGSTASVLSDRSFVGQLDDEENVPVTFTMAPAQPRPDCEVTVQYSDAQQRTTTESFTFAAAEQRASPVLLGVAAVAVIAAGLYWRRTRRQDELAEV